MESFIAGIIDNIGENISREGLKDTPKRVAKAYQELTYGYHQTHKDIVGDALFPAPNNEMVVVQDIEFFSLCEHHLLPFFGHCHVAYIPNKKVIGLSKIPRLVDMYAKRLQVQEHLTYQIAQALQEITQSEGVFVVIQARHCCVMMRGIKKQESSMTTNVKLGAFKNNPQMCQEFWQQLRLSR